MHWTNDETPIGILMSRVARQVERSFDRRLGGGESRWRILRTLAMQPADNQSALAQAVGVRDATLVHHIDILETEGLVERKQSKINRRMQTVALTQAGQAMFQSMLKDVVSFDAKLRAAIGAEAEADFRAVLLRIERNLLI